MDENDDLIIVPYSHSYSIPVFVSECSGERFLIVDSSSEDGNFLDQILKGFVGLVSRTVIMK